LVSIVYIFASTMILLTIKYIINLMSIEKEN